MKRSITLTTCLLIAALCVQAQNFETCDRWASWDVNGYTIYNNIWGDGYGTQCLWAYDQGNWGVWADHPDNGGIKSYPNVDYDVNYTVSSMPDITASFNATTPGWGSYNTAFDIWYNNYGYEIMLWANWNGSMGPISYNYGCSGYPSTACPVATNVNVGGHTWNLYEGTNGSATVYSFLRTSDTNSGTVNITQISEWLASNGYFGWNTNLHEIQFGFEITSSSGGADFRVNSYSINIDNSGGGGGGGGSYYTMTNRSSGKCVDVSGWSSSNNTNVQQWDCHGGENQQFELVDVGSGYYNLRARHSGKCLRAVNGNIVQYDCNNGWWSEMFERISAGSGYYIVRSRNTGSCLRVENSSGSNGASIVLSPCNTGWWSQQFSFSGTGSGSRVGEVQDARPTEALTSDVLLVYPNPSETGDFTIEVPETWIDSKLAIFDLSGRKFFTRRLKGAGKMAIRAELKPGVYFVNVIGNGITEEKKLVVK